MKAKTACVSAVSMTLRNECQLLLGCTATAAAQICTHLLTWQRSVDPDLRVGLENITSCLCWCVSGYASGHPILLWVPLHCRLLTLLNFGAV